MKKVFLGMGILLCVLLLTGYGKSDLTDYIQLSYSGIDTKGSADYSVNDTEMIEDIYGINLDNEIPDDKMQKKIQNLLESYKVTLSKTKNLSNEDKVEVSVSVDSEKREELKNNVTKTFTVSGLEKWGKIR